MKQRNKPAPVKQYPAESLITAKKKKKNEKALPHDKADAQELMLKNKLNRT